MAKVGGNISMSLDGFVTGPNLNRYPGLGEGGEILHAWTDESRSMDLAMGEKRQIAGSVITSRKVYDETGGWDAEDGFYRMPVFVVTHRPHEVVEGRDHVQCSSPRASSTPSSRRSWPLGTSWHIMGGASTSSRRWRPGWSTSCSCTSPR